MVVPQGNILVYFMFYVTVGKLLQKIATRQAYNASRCLTYFDNFIL